MNHAVIFVYPDLGTKQYHIAVLHPATLAADLLVPKQYEGSILIRWEIGEGQDSRMVGITSGPRSTVDKKRNASRRHVAIYLPELQGDLWQHTMTSIQVSQLVGSSF